MRNPEEKLAHRILVRDGTWGMTGCLADAKGSVALRGHGVLDDFSHLHVRLLALLCSGLNCDDATVELHIGADAVRAMDSCMDDLHNAGFVDWNGTEYTASATGRSVIRQIGIEMLGMDRYRMTGELEAAERLLKKLGHPV